jgi:hypothetical protein
VAAAHVKQLESAAAGHAKQRESAAAAHVQQLKALAAAHDEEVNGLYEQLLAEKQQVLQYCAQETTFLTVVFIQCLRTSVVELRTFTVSTQTPG